MIIITRTYDVKDPDGIIYLRKTTRRVFADDEIQRVQLFLDERSQISGYEWYNVQFDYVKL